MESDPALSLTLDLPAQTLTGSDGFKATFDIEPAPKGMLIEGLDAIGLTLTRRDEIEDFRRHDRVARPWVYERADRATGP